MKRMIATTLLGASLFSAAGARADFAMVPARTAPSGGAVALPGFGAVAHRPGHVEVCPSGPRLVGKADQRQREVKRYVELRSYKITVTERQQRYNVDPWKAKLYGFKDGEQVSLATQEPSEIFDLSALGTHSGLAVRRALRQAVRWKTAKTFDGVTPPQAQVDSLGPVGSAPPLVLEGSEEIAVHAPLKVSARDPRTGFVASVLTQAQGLRTDEKYEEKLIQEARPGGGYNQHYTRVMKTTRKSGLEQQHYVPWVRAENLFVTPAFESPTGEGIALLRGFAAFPLSAKVTVTNLDMHKRGMRGASVEVKLTRRTGSTKQVVLPAPAGGGTYELVVELPGREGESNTRRLVHTFQLPDPDSPEVQARGVQPYGVSLDAGRQETRRAELPSTQGFLTGSF